MFLTALRVPKFADELVSVGQATRNFNVTFTKESLHLLPPGPPPTYAQTLRQRTKQNVYVTNDGDNTDLAAPCAK